jgi:hypothetical protein
MSNLYVGLHRDARGERLAATRLIQVHALDRVLDILELTGAGARQDPFTPERGVERGYGPDVLPLAEFVPGYERNRQAARALLDWLEARVDVHPAMAAAVRELLLPPTLAT